MVPYLDVAGPDGFLRRHRLQLGLHPSPLGDVDGAADAVGSDEGDNAVENGSYIGIEAVLDRGG